MRVAARGGGVVRTRRVGHNRGSDFLRKAAMQHTCAEAWAGHVLSSVGARSQDGSRVCRRVPNAENFFARLWRAVSLISNID